MSIYSGNLCINGTAIGTLYNSNCPPSRAFDGIINHDVNNNYWWGGIAPSCAGAYLGYIFPNPVNIRRVAIYTTAVTSIWNGYSMNVALQYLDDSSVWHTVQNFIIPLGTDSEYWKYIEVNQHDYSQHIQWRVYWNSGFGMSDSGLFVDEMQMFSQIDIESPSIIGWIE